MHVALTLSCRVAGDEGRLDAGSVTFPVVILRLHRSRVHADTYHRLSFSEERGSLDGDVHVDQGSQSVREYLYTTMEWFGIAVWVSPIHVNMSS